MLRQAKLSLAGSLLFNNLHTNRDTLGGTPLIHKSTNDTLLSPYNRAMDLVSKTKYPQLNPGKQG